VSSTQTSRALDALRQAARTARSRVLIRSVAILGSAEALARLLGIVSIVVVSRVIGPDGLGNLSFALALVGYAAVLGDGGLTIFLQRQIAAGQANVDRDVSAATVTQSLLGVVLIVALVAGLQVLPVPPATAPLMLILAPLLVAQAFSLTYVFQAREQMVPVARIRILSQVLVALVGITGVVVTRNVLWMAVGYSIGVFAGDVVCYLWLRAAGQFHPRRFPRAAVLELLRHGAPFLGITLLTQIFISLDVVVLGFTRPATQVGEYGAAFRLVFFVFSTSSVLSAAAFPRLVQTLVADRAAFAQKYLSLVRLTARAALAVAGFLLVESTPIVQGLFGERFAGSVDLVRVLVFWVPLGFYNSLASMALMATGHQRRYMAVLATAGLVMASILVLAVPAIGPKGAAIAVVARELSIAAFASWALRDSVGLTGMRAFVGELPFLLLPAAAGALVYWQAPVVAPLAAGVAWFTVVVAIEWLRGWPTYREVLARTTA
jgi:O-antigen/teichoic acid export membrane protein